MTGNQLPYGKTCCFENELYIHFVHKAEEYFMHTKQKRNPQMQLSILIG